VLPLLVWTIYNTLTLPVKEKRAMPPTQSHSPMTSSFLSSTSNHIASGPVRRNLFSTHLSRRPASGAQPPQLDGHNDQHASQSQQQQQQHGSALPRLRSHQRSASTPSLLTLPTTTISLPTTTPTTGRTQAYVPHPIPQLSPPHRATLADGYDPTISA